MSDRREVIEGQQVQGDEEKIVYRITTTPWASNPVLSAIKAFDVTGRIRTDVSSTILEGEGSVAGDIISTPIVQSLTPHHIYRIEIKFTSGGLTFEFWLEILAEY